MDVTPISVVVGDTNTVSDAQKAHAQLTALAEKQRANAPWMSVAQCYARVMADESNAELGAPRIEQAVVGALFGGGR